MSPGSVPVYAKMYKNALPLAGEQRLSATLHDTEDTRVASACAWSNGVIVIVCRPALRAALPNVIVRDPLPSKSGKGSISKIKLPANASSGKVKSMTKVELILDSTEEEGKWRVGLDCAAVWGIRVRIRRGRRWIMVPR